MKYHLLYADHCSMKIKRFDTEKEMKAFVADFLANRPNKADYFIDGMFYGQLGWIDESIEVSNG